MAETQYIVNDSDFNQNTGLSGQDSYLSKAVSLNSDFNAETDYIEIAVFDIQGNPLGTFPGTSQSKELLNSNSAGTQGTSTLYLDPIAFAKSRFANQNIILQYSFLRRLTVEQFYISKISPDRLEVKVTSLNSNEIDVPYETILGKLSTSTYFPKLLLEFSSTDRRMITNVDRENQNLLLKLYAPIGTPYREKTRVRLIEEIANSISYEIRVTTPPQEIKQPVLRGPNFSIELEDQSDISTGYLDYTDLFAYPVNGTYNRIFSEVSGSEVNINVDYTAFENFVHFSSAKERLVNFKYKLDLIHSYEAAKVANAAITNSTVITTATSDKYDNLIKGVLSNFDGFERHLYFESGSTSWPKTSNVLPYENELSTTAPAISWFENTLASASLYDELNESRLNYTIPEYIRQDSNNEPYGLFTDMIGQHFDTLWIYAKGFTDKYDADNRLDYGISKDLIVKTLQNFGVKLYSSNFSTANLSKLLLGEWYDSGEEQIKTFVTATTDPTPDSELLHETYKRIYHNLPYLLKTKGTERGLRALINCFGIPSGSIQIREYGGLINTLDFNPGLDYPSQADEKIRLDNTGSLIPGDTLSYYTSNVKPEDIYNQDLHVVEVGFSPSYYIDEYIVHYTLPPTYVSGTNLKDIFSFPKYRIDDYVGDPRNVNKKQHTELNRLRDQLLGNLERYDVYDFIRLIKFFDNQLFKMIKDFTPARDTVSTGIIIRPHLLDRSKTGEPAIGAERSEYTASIDTAFIEGSEPGVIGNFSVAHSEVIPTTLGYVNEVNDTEEEKINGELGGTSIQIGLTSDNPFEQYTQPKVLYGVTHYTDYKDFADTDFPTSLLAGDIRIYVEALTFANPGELEPIDVGVGVTPVGNTITLTIVGLKDYCGKGSGTVVKGGNTLSTITANSGTTTTAITSTTISVNSGDTITLNLSADMPTGTSCQGLTLTQTRGRIAVNNSYVALALSDTVSTDTYTFTPTANTTIQFSYTQIPA